MRKVTFFHEAIPQFHAWLSHRKCTPKTCREWSSDIAYFAAFLARHLPPQTRQLPLISSPLEPDIKVPLTAATPATIQSWLEQEAIAHSPRTLARRYISLSAFFRWATGAKLISSNPLQYVPPPQAPVIAQRTLTQAEITRLIAAADQLAQHDDPRWAAFVRLILDAGLKRSEALKLRLHDFTPDAPPTIMIRHSARHLNFKTRQLTLSDDTARAITALIHWHTRSKHTPEYPLFPFSPRTAEERLKSLSHEAAVHPHVTCEQLRWTALLRDYFTHNNEASVAKKYGLSGRGWSHARERLEKMRRENREVPLAV